MVMILGHKFGGWIGVSECSEFNLEKGTFTVAVGCAGEMRRRIKTGTEIELNAAGWSWIVCKRQKKRAPFDDSIDQFNCWTLDAPKVIVEQAHASFLCAVEGAI